MRFHILPMLAVISCSAGAQGYYEQAGPQYPQSRVVPAPNAAAKSSPTNVRRLVVTDDAANEQRYGGARFDGLSGQSREDGNGVALPPNMERGIRDLEAGLEDVSAYTGEMAAHLQKNGLRGYLAVPPELRDKGRSVGRKVGNGIGAIMHDVGKEMVAPAPQ